MAAGTPVLCSRCTLLGFVRENGFICGDPDIDIGMFAEHHDASVVDSAACAGFALIQQTGSKDDGLSLKFHNGKVQIDLILYYSTADRRQSNAYQRGNRIRYSHPSFKLEPAVFQGMPIMIPSDPESLLRAHYGPSWRTPSTYWNYAFSPDNAKPEGHLLWRMYFAWRRAKWKLRDMARAAGWLKTLRESSVLPPIHKRNNILDTGIVFTDGVFDMIHTIHLKMLEDAKKLGEYLVVAVATDELASSYKRRPVIGEQERLFMVQSLKCVDEAFLLSGPLDAARMERLLAHYQPRKGINSTDIIKSIQSRQDLK